MHSKWLRVLIKKRRVLSCLSSILLLFGCESENVKVPSASINVQVLAKEFAMPGLNRTRTVRLYLPPDYHKESTSYPVLYMHDGQNLFDDSTSYAGEWGIDETLNKLHQQNKLSFIVVGIDNGQEKRMNELSPWQNEKFGQAEGEFYMKFIVEVVKPYIDNNYRTLPDADNTAIIGSSMGGLISHYAIFEHPNVFSKAGIFSPSYWYSKDVYSYSDPRKLGKNARLFFLMGGAEGADTINNMDNMVSQIKQQGFPESNIASHVVQDGEHNEAFWQHNFERAVLWLFDKEK